MIRLREYIKLYEGGQAGHMAHPFDYTDFTANDLIDLVGSLFQGKIEDLKEKLDGMNIMATMNSNGQVVFIRNKSNLNSENGGMTIDDMAEKWAKKEHQKKVFLQAGEIITNIFSKLGKAYFNPDATHRKVVNCECIIAGKTNIMPYAADRVAFHGYKIYELVDGKYKEIDDVEGDVDDIYRAADGIDAAKPRPSLVIRSAEQGIAFANRFIKEITKLWKEEGLPLDATIEDWKMARFAKYAPEWCRNDKDVFARICDDDKTVKLGEIKKRYPDHKEEVALLNTDIKKEVAGNIMEPMDNLFLEIGNELIDLLDGFVNTGSKDKVIAQLKSDMEKTIHDVESSSSDKAKASLAKSLHRLQALGDKYNAAEGIVIMYKGRRLKMTGSFAPINQALGTRYELE